MSLLNSIRSHAFLLNRRSVEFAPKTVISCVFPDFPLSSLIQRMTTVRNVLESFISNVLESWTALELAVAHYGGQYREGQAKRISLTESLSEAVLTDQYEVEDIAEFLNLYLFDEFSMELDDMSHFEVAKVLLDGWSQIKRGLVPAMLQRSSGAQHSTLADNTEEVSDAEDDTEMGEEPTKSSNGPKIITDEDGWSTVVSRNDNRE